MRVIYLDTLFLLNAGLDGLLLAAANRLAGGKKRWRRILIASAFGAGYAAFAFLTASPLLVHPAVRLLAAFVMVWIAFNGEKRLIRILGVFFLLSCTLAGAVLLMQHTGLGTFSNRAGFPLTAGDGRLLLLCGAGEYLLVSTLSHHPGVGKAETVSVLLCCEGRKVLLKALVDSGNLLRDPITGENVLIADFIGIETLFPSCCRLNAQDFQRPDELFTLLSEVWDTSRLKLLPYHTVGTPQGLLLAVKTDWMEINGQLCPNRLAAITGMPLSAEGCYHGIINLGYREGFV